MPMSLELLLPISSFLPSSTLLLLGLSFTPETAEVPDFVFTSHSGSGPPEQSLVSYSKTNWRRLVVAFEKTTPSLMKSEVNGSSW